MLALNYDGDPHRYPFPVYPTSTRMQVDRWGTQRLPILVTHLRPDIIVVVNDPWNFPPYLARVGTTPVVGSIAVDGANCRGTSLNGLRHAIFWTHYGVNQARLGGYTGPASIVPLGVDLSVYHPTEQAESRRRIGLPAQLRGSDTFIVGVGGRNHPRKRFDLALIYFAKWIKEAKIQNAYLFVHEGPTGDTGYDLDQLAQYLQIHNRIIISKPEIGQGMHEEHLKYVYGALDVMLSTATGEGWGLMHMEGMACGIPQILPDWSALGEWAADAACMVPCTSVVCTPNNINALGGVPDEAKTVRALDLVYRNPQYRASLAEKGLALVQRPEFRWEAIGAQFEETLTQCLSPLILEQVPSEATA